MQYCKMQSALQKNAKCFKVEYNGNIARDGDEQPMFNTAIMHSSVLNDFLDPRNVMEGIVVGFQWVDLLIGVAPEKNQWR